MNAEECGRCVEKFLSTLVMLSERRDDILLFQFVELTEPPLFFSSSDPDGSALAGSLGHVSNRRRVIVATSTIRHLGVTSGDWSERVGKRSIERLKHCRLVHIVWKLIHWSEWGQDPVWRLW